MKVSYTTLTDYDLIHLEQKVNQMTQLGWRLHSSYWMTGAASHRHVAWLVHEEPEESK